jgi:hypothetical protein
MKCAYLFSGQPIFYNDVLNYNSNYQISSTDKVCAHLWWNNDYFNKVYKFWFTDRYHEKDLDQKFIERYGVTDFLIERHKNFDLTFSKKFNFEVWKDETIEHYKVVTPIVLYSLLSQSYSNYQAFLQTQKYNDIDVIIRSRPDIILVNPLKNILSQIPLEEDTIYFQNSMSGGHLYAGEFPNRPCDWFFLGTTKSMEKYCNAWYNSIMGEQKNGLIHHYEYIHNICQKQKLNIRLVDFGAIIYKQATNWYEKYKINPKFYINNFDYENSTPLETSLWPYWVENINFKHFANLKNIV